MDNKFESGVIFTSNQDTAYNFRNKCSKIGLPLSYALNLEDLFKYILDNERSLIFVDAECDALCCLYELLNNKHKNSGNHKFILIDDNNKVNIEPNNKTFYITNNKEVNSLISNITKHTNEALLLPIDKAKLYSTTIEVINNIGISSSLQGNEYIIQAVCLCIEKGNVKINFQSEIYPVIASNFNTSIFNIEKCIRRCVNDFSKKMKNKPNLFPPDQKITNSSLIKYLINIVKIKYLNSINN